MRGLLRKGRDWGFGEWGRSDGGVEEWSTGVLEYWSGEGIGYQLLVIGNRGANDQGPGGRPEARGQRPGAEGRLVISYWLSGIRGNGGSDQYSVNSGQ